MASTTFSQQLDSHAVSPNGGKYQNLMKFVKNHPSEISSSCALASNERFEEILSSLPNVVVVTEKLNEYFRGYNPLTFAQFEEKLAKGDLGKYTFVFFGESSGEDYRHNDEYIAKVLSKV